MDIRPTSLPQRGEEGHPWHGALPRAVEMVLAPLGQTLEVTRQALACRCSLWLQRTRLVYVSIEEGRDTCTLLRITPLGVQIHADDR